MVEFSRIQLIIQEDLAKSLLALRADFKVSSVALILDISQAVDLSPADPRSAPLRASLRKFQRVTSLKVDLPLVELEAAQEDIKVFLSNRLQELSSQDESHELFGELSQQLSRSWCRTET